MVYHCQLRRVTTTKTRTEKKTVPTRFMPQWIWFAFRSPSRLSILFLYDRLCFLLRSFVLRQCISYKKHLNESVIRGCMKSSPENRKRPLL